MNNRKASMPQFETGHEDLHQQLIVILSDVFQVEIEPSIDDILQQDLEEWDSFNHLRLVSELEDVFQIALSDEEIPELVSLQRIKAVLEHKGITRVHKAES